MNIFAKRKRKSAEATPPVAAAEAVEKTFQSDAVVEELLQQDPSSWNAKQRRLIKRYQDRGPQPKATGTTDTDERPIETIATVAVDESKDVEQCTDNASNDDTVPLPADALAETNSTPQLPVETKVSSTSNEKNDSAKDAEPATVDPELQEILDQLNSKQRRKLVRMLERGSDIEVVRTEAKLQLAQETSGQGPSVPEPPPVEPPKKRRKGGAVDLATLTPEERMRRDEQRRLQQEAALARQAKVETGTTASTTHKHPLNSERRRANRRKPKWEGRRSNEPAPNEHDSSGYHMRKITGKSAPPVK